MYKRRLFVPGALLEDLAVFSCGRLWEILSFHREAYRIRVNNGRLIHLKLWSYYHI